MVIGDFNSHIYGGYPIMGPNGENIEEWTEAKFPPLVHDPKMPKSVNSADM